MATAFVLATLFALPLFAQRTLVVYLPDSPAESAKKLAESVTALQQMVSARSGVPFELKFFRKADDCAAYLSSNRASVAVAVAPPEFLAEAAPELVPILRFSRDGRETYRRIVIVRSGDPAKSLADLHGRTISTIQPAEGMTRSALRGEPGLRIVEVPDDLAAAANAMYGTTDAALVSELNPLAAAHLGKELRVLYTTAPLPLPVIAIRPGAFSGRERESVEQALLAAGSALSTLQISGFERFDVPKPVEEKKVEFAAVPADAIDLPAPNTARLGATALLTVEVPDVVLPEGP
jgi:ABC-type nitrate/sulfonate/bicarbonate transport system substrate-binding protein